MNEACLALDVAAFTAAFDREPLLVQHHLADHPLLRRTAIADLATWLPPDCVERNEAQLPLVLPGGGSPRGGVESPADVVRGIDDNGSWLVLWNIEQHAEYRALLEACLDPILPMLPPAEARFVRREAFMFVSSPRSLTPVHFDPEHNFLLQIAGTKKVDVAAFTDDRHRTDELERYYRGGHRNLDKAPPPGRQFVLQPGQGVYIPSHFPHWVSNGDEASLSLSITFHTPGVIRRGRVHACNSALRGFGIAPREPDRSQLIDGAKSAVMQGRALAGQLISRLRGKHG